MKRLIIVLFLLLFVRAAQAVDVPEELKSVLKKKYLEIEFKIDNSFTINDKSFIPLVPKVARKTNDVEIVFTVPGKPLPKLIWFSNDWAYARLISIKDNQLSILSFAEIPKQYKDRFTKMKFPDDLVVPKNFVISNELSFLKGELPIETLEAKTWVPGEITPDNHKQDSVTEEHLKSNLFLTSPDDGKIIYLNLEDPSTINSIETKGLPWELAYNNKSMTIYVTDFFNNQIYEIDPDKPSIISTTTLKHASNPKDISISQDGTSIYILESKDKYFTTLMKKDNKTIFIKKNLALDPAYFTILEKENLIAISHPSISKITFLNKNNFQDEGFIKIDGGPDEIINDDSHFYVANRFNDTVLVISAKTQTIVEEIKVDKAPIALAIDTKNKNLYVGSGKDNTVLVLDTNTHVIKDRITLPVETQFPSDLELSKDGKWLIVTSEDSTTISVVNLEEKDNIQTIDVGVPTHAALLIED